MWFVVKVSKKMIFKEMAYCNGKHIFNHCSFPIPPESIRKLEVDENQFSIFRGYRSGTSPENGLNNHKTTKYIESQIPKECCKKTCGILSKYFPGLRTGRSQKSTTKA